RARPQTGQLAPVRRLPHHGTARPVIHSGGAEGDGPRSPHARGRVQLYGLHGRRHGDRPPVPAHAPQRHRALQHDDHLRRPVGPVHRRRGLRDRDRPHQPDDAGEAVIALGLGLAALAVVATAVHGLRLLRTDPLSELSEQDRGLIHRSVRAKKTDVGPVGRLAATAGRELTPLLGDGYRRVMTARIVESGRADYADFSQFMAMKAKLAVLGALPALLICLYFNYWVVGLGFIAVLFFIPDIALWSKASERQEQIED